MSPRGGSRSSFGVLQIILGVAALLVVGIVLAIMFAPDKPKAPPTSKVTYRAESPKGKKAPGDAEPLPLPDLPGVPKRGADATSAKEEKKPEAEKPYKVIGLVIDARTKQPIADALVTLRRQWTPAEQRDWEGRNAQARLGTDQALGKALREEHDRLQATARGRSKEDGRFEVGLDVPGQYEAEGVHRQYMAQKAMAGLLNAETPGIEIQLLLSTGATISGKVTEIGSPTPAAEVTVAVEGDGVHSSKTDAKGMYQIAGLSPGEYGVKVETTGTAYKPGQKLPFQKVEIQKASQDVRDVNFEVEPAGVVWGYIRGADQQPIKGAEVLLMAPESLLSQVITAAVKQAPPVRGASQEDGYYELLGVPINQEWRVYATSKSASPQLAEPFMLTGEVRSVQIDVYLYGGTDVHGIVIDTKSQPIADAEVVCIPSYTALLSPTDAPAAFRNAKSGVDGSFTIEKLPAGDYQIMAQKKDYKVPTSGTGIYPDGMSELNNVEVRLLPVDEGTHYVTGTVTDVRTRQGVSGANVRLQGFGSETMNNFSRETSTDGSGKFTIDGLEAGMYRLRVSKDGYAARTIPRVLLDTETAVPLDQSAVVRGVVLVKEGNSPPKVEYSVTPAVLSDNGTVNVFGSSDLGEIGGTSFSNTDGSWQLYLPPGNYRLQAHAEGYTDGREVVAVSAGQVMDGVTLYVTEAGGTIGGHVTAKSGESVTGTKVQLVEVGNMGGDAATGGGRQMTIGDDGMYSFPNLGEGTYYAIAINQLYANAKSRTVQLGGNQNITDADIKLGSGGSIEGKVYAQGKPQAGATVLAASIDTGSTGTATTGPDGTYQIMDLGAGKYTVTWVPAGTGSVGDLGNSSGRQTQVVEGQSAHLDFGLNGVTITGMCVPGPMIFLLPVNYALLQEVGSPLPASPGQAINMESLLRLPVVASVQVQGSGQFVFEGVPEGTYQVSIYYGFPGGGGGQGGGPGGGTELRLVGFQEQVTAGTPVTIQTRY